PTSSAPATASAISGPLSVNIRKNDRAKGLAIGLWLAMRIDRKMECLGTDIIAESGFKRANSLARYAHHRPGIGRRRQGRRTNVAVRVTAGLGPRRSRLT